MTEPITTHEEGRALLRKIYAEKKEFNKRYQIIFEAREKASLMDDIPRAKTFHALAAVTFRSFVDVYDTLEKLSIVVSESVENLDKRLMNLEKAIEDLGGKINSDNIVAVAKFAADFNKQVAESKKELEQYKRKMAENDLAT